MTLDNRMKTDGKCLLIACQKTARVRCLQCGGRFCTEHGEKHRRMWPQKLTIEPIVGKARAKALTKRQRSAIARKAGLASGAARRKASAA
jgi:hypothetical protein